MFVPIIVQNKEIVLDIHILFSSKSKQTQISLILTKKHLPIQYLNLTELTFSMWVGTYIPHMTFSNRHLDQLDVYNHLNWKVKAFNRHSYLSICFPGFIEALTIDTLMRHWVKTLTNCFDVFCYLAFCSWYDVICFLKHPLVAFPYHYGQNLKKIIQKLLELFPF